MVTTYRLNTRELETAFNAIKNTYPNRVVEIEVREQDEMDETEYLMSFPATRKRLDEAVKNIEEGKNLITFASLEEAQKRVEELAEKQ